MDSETPTTMRVRFSFLRVGERNEKKRSLTINRSFSNDMCNPSRKRTRRKKRRRKHIA
jgi:hypothetical protein